MTFYEIIKNDFDPMLRAGVKYCGGCNPEYDRVALVEQIKGRLEGKVSFVPSESEGVDIILAVHGCRTACADLSGFRGIETRTVTGNEEGEEFVREIIEREV
ncbi:MAG TPA: hypothetical protein ENH70_05450 [Desulfobacteraceae bacterium]|nr:hypothetical protein [Desulfobacteraceae bacterium]